jgi:hypothetical protein
MTLTRGMGVDGEISNVWSPRSGGAGWPERTNVNGRQLADSWMNVHARVQPGTPIKHPNLDSMRGPPEGRAPGEGNRGIGGGACFTSQSFSSWSRCWVPAAPGGEVLWKHPARPIPSKPPEIEAPGALACLRVRPDSTAGRVRRNALPPTVTCRRFPSLGAPRPCLGVRRSSPPSTPGTDMRGSCRSRGPSWPVRW